MLSKNDSSLQSKTSFLKNELLKLRKSSLRIVTYMISLIENKKDSELARKSKLDGSNLQ